MSISTAAPFEGLVQIRVPDDSAYWTEMVKCRHACPVHTDACGYVRDIADGNLLEAYRKIRATNPFASICGRVCGAPCEANCRRGFIDEPVAIRALKRYVNEVYGPESGDYSLYRESADLRMLPPNRGEYERIAVVGGGVAGMTVAHDLVQIGYKVTVFEANKEPGGMMLAGVPVYRLPREVVRHEIQAILSLGVELKCNMRLGRDFTIDSLRKDGFAAIFLGIGLQKGRKLPLPGSDLPDVYDGMEFLRAFNEGKPLPMGRRIAVIGGGNVAYDVARSAIRPAWYESSSDTIAEVDHGSQMAYDVARSAARLSGDKEVHIVCLESREEMPADEIEIVEGAEEGLKLHARRGPREVLSRDGKVIGLRTVVCKSVFDENRKFAPVFDEAAIDDIPVDTVVFAIGQSSDLSFLKPEDGVETERGLIKIHPETYQTTAPDVFACGDVAHGARLFIDAVASAHVAARSMHDYLRKTRTDVVLRKSWSPASYWMEEGWNGLDREEPPVIGAEQRVAGIDIIEQRYPEEMAHFQASRCLRCNINTVFDTSKCIACNGCVDVCPESLIRLVGMSELIKDDTWMEQAVEMLDGKSPDLIRQMPAAELDALGGVMTKDESTCIRCAMCASRCPTHAITMQMFQHHWECVSIDARNPKINYGHVG
jgi:NADPH-dependent glutamate synthase beta subunit-like oxidoreductase